MLRPRLGPAPAPRLKMMPARCRPRLARLLHSLRSAASCVLRALRRDVYLDGTVMLIFGMGLYSLFISNASTDVPSESDRALSGLSLFGMFALKDFQLEHLLLWFLLETMHNLWHYLI